MTIRVMVVDDQQLVRAGFSMVLDREPDIDVVAEASDGLEATQLAPGAAPDIVLMDIRMPVVDGVEATRRLLKDATSDRPRVIILTTFDLDEYVFQALQAGASGFLLKDVHAADLINAVRTVAAGDAMLAPSVTRRLLDQFASTRPAAPPPEMASLTDREMDVFRLIARGLSNAEMAAELFVGESTVKTHVSRVLSKLGLRHRTQAAVLAYEVGIVRPGDNLDQKSDGA